MGEREALLQAVIADPDDDTPRLIYADWLDEHGQVEQAEFIRASIRLARLAPDDDSTRPNLATHVEAVEKAHAAAWLGALGLNADGLVPEYRRGFVERLYYHGPRAFFASGDAWFRLCPVRQLALHASQGDHLDESGIKRLAAWPPLARLNDLRLWDQQSVPLAGWEALFASPHLANLRTLSLNNCALDEEAVALLARSPHLAGLTRLDLGYCVIGVAGARALLNSPYLSRLATLCVEHNFFGDEEGEDEVIAELEARFGDGLSFEELDD